MRRGEKFPFPSLTPLVSLKMNGLLFWRAPQCF
uniref:Uncharacterized protein n=1 Tax=Anguilla anguilla TaxID=7936 RepID=A0A0E9TB21_ANGAN